MEEKNIDQKAIRTYESDIANALQHQQTSQVSMIIADEQKREKEKVVVVKNIEKPPKDHSGSHNVVKNTLMIFGSLLLLAAGIGALYYFYKLSPLSVTQPSTPTATSSIIVASIIPVENQKILDITGQNKDQIIQLINKQTQSISQSGNSNIEQIVLAEQASTTANSKTTSALTQITGPQFISSIGLVPPDSFTSSLTNQWMLGFYSSTENNASSSLFIILTNNFFQNSFSGMLAWETTMPSELSSLFGIQSEQWAEGSFHDKLIKNKDVREFVDSNGNTIFLYSFINNSTLVIAQNEATLSEIISRFESQSYVR